MFAPPCRRSSGLALLGLALAVAAPSALRAQDASVTDATRIRVQMDSLRVVLERLSREQMADIERMNESRRDELNELRAALVSQSQAMLEAQRGLTAAQRDLLEAEQQLNQNQRAQIEEVRARLIEEYDRLGDTIRARGLAAPGVRGFGGITILRGDSLGCSGDACPRAVIRYNRDGFAYADSFWVNTDSTYTFRWSFPPEPATPFAAPTISPFFIGGRAVAGAQLTDLNPDLARYFDVEAGVLVTDVTTGSAAEEAGLRSGDVIVQVNDQPVTNVDEVRREVAEWDFPLAVVMDAWARTPRPTRPRQSQEPITLGIVRDGEAIRVELPR